MTILAESSVAWGWWALCYFVALLGVAGSALFSGLETGVYRINRVRLHLLAQKSHSNAAILAEMLKHPNRLLGTLLIGNNVVNYIASYAIATLLVWGEYGDWQQVAINAAVLTPLLFIFGEVLPKDLFSTYSDHLTPTFAWLLRWLQRLFMVTGLLPLINGLYWSMARLMGLHGHLRMTFHPRRIVTQMIAEGVGHGLLSQYQTNIIDRVLHPTERTVEDAMVRWADVVKLTVGQPVEAVWALADRVPHARFPLVGARGEVIGVVEMFDVLVHGMERCPKLKDIAKSVPRLPRATSLREALRLLQTAQSPMGIVMDQDAEVGIVTFKDLVEPITGDLEAW